MSDVVGLVVCTFANSCDLGAMVLYCLGCEGKLWGTCFIIPFTVFWWVLCLFRDCYGFCSKMSLFSAC